MKNEFETAFDNLMTSYEEFKRLVKQKDKNVYNRWKAGGFLVDHDIMSMYPDATKVFELLDEGEGEDSVGDYISKEECVESGIHLDSCDDSGYCNYCGNQ